MRKVVLAFDSFKGCISATEACHAAAKAIRSSWPEVQVVEIPMSDGGEGLVQAVKGYKSHLPEAKLTSICFQAHGPLMEPVMAEYLLEGDTAYMEMAATSGLPLVPVGKRNPMLTTTYGVGEMILDACHRGAKHIMMGIGGSATNDGGRGMLLAIREAGVSLQELPSITVACDVSNPLCGPMGASAVFGPQKGATPAMVRQLDAQLQAFAEQAIAEGIATAEMMNHPGAGAAGGLGFGLMSYLHAELKSGIDILLDIVDFDRQIQGADWVITGEGKSDEQTLMGKVPYGILKRCQQQSIPVWLLSGTIDDPQGQLHSSFQTVASINAGDPRPLEVLMRPEVALQNLSQYFINLKEE